MKPSFKFRFLLSLIMSLVVGLVMSLAMMLYNGMPLIPMLLLTWTLLATLVGLVVMLALPVAQLGSKFSEFYGAKQGSLGHGLLQSVIIATVMTLCVSFGMTAYATGFGATPDGTSFIVRWLTPVSAIWGTAYLTTIVVLPVAAAIAGGRKRPQAAE